MKVLFGVLLIVVGLVLLVGTVFSPLISSKKSNDKEVTADLTSVKEIDFSGTTVNWNIQITDNDRLTVELLNEAREMGLLSKMQNGTLKIEVNEPKFRWFSFNFRGSTKATVYLPKNYKGHLKVNSVSGDLSFSDDFTLEDVKIKTVSGDVVGSTLSASHVEVATTSGDIDMYHLTVNSLKANSVSGDIQIGEMNGEVEGKTVSGDLYIQYENENQKAYLKTVSGDVELLIPLANAVVSLNSISGNLRVEAKMHDQMIQPRSISGKIGEGLHQMTIKTTSGDIRIR
ncbi:DUF4097 family beta strand repeat-containing protein [Halalkalibacter kiskunsagensis]|uniref:DUF4097 family beta strand repeat-containing protein n=1 Tax=Halalkalibacter kiskunsagensis TaxID=1548599 RepID=A0ABV6KK28_9BACI